MHRSQYLCVLLALFALFCTVHSFDFRQALHCGSCKTEMEIFWKKYSDKLDTVELLDNLLSICEGLSRSDNPDPEEARICTNTVELIYNSFSKTENLCILLGICPDTENLLQNGISRGPDCNEIECLSTAANCAYECSCKQTCSPACYSCFGETANLCQNCFFYKQ
mmetsp:Transcript_20238/g.28388  ORF Transcript_20238/g.28388 Transcript_20238/m.28388 type:complete len:166 (+) Transcript_20238:23-520(+)